MEKENEIEEIFKIKAKEIYQNCRLTGIKVIGNEDIKTNFGKEIFNILNGDGNENCAIFSKNGTGLKNNPELAKYYLSQLVEIDAIQHEITNRSDGIVDTKKRLDFELFLTDKSGKEHIVKFENFQFGLNNTTKGFEHLLQMAKSIDENKSILKNSNNELDKICSVPSYFSAKAQNKAHEIVRSLCNSISKEISPELSNFLKAFANNFLNSKEYSSREQFIREYERDERRKKEKENKNKNENIVVNEKVSIENPKNIQNSEYSEYEIKKYDKENEPEHIKFFKSDMKKFNEYAKNFEKINENSKLSDEQKKEAIKNLESEYGVSASEFLAIKSEQVKKRQEAILDKKKDPAIIAEKNQIEVENYDDYFLKCKNAKNGIKAEIFAPSTEPEYIKIFKADIARINAYENEYKKIFNEHGEIKNKNTANADIKKLEQNFKISVGEFLGVKYTQMNLRKEAIQDVIKNGTAKVSNQIEQIKNNIPSSRGL